MNARKFRKNMSTIEKTNYIRAHGRAAYERLEFCAYPAELVKEQEFHRSSMDARDREWFMKEFGAENYAKIPF